MSNSGINKNIDTVISSLNNKADNSRVDTTDKNVTLAQQTADAATQAAQAAHSIAESANTLINTTVTQINQDLENTRSEINISLNTTKTEINTAVDNKLKNISGIPSGFIVPFASTSSPGDGWLVCNGATISRTTYSKLFSAIGTTFGAGDGSTTFTIPNISDSRYIQGSTSIGYVGQGLPNISGSFHLGSCGAQDKTSSGCFSFGDQYNGDDNNSKSKGNAVKFNASRSNSIYGSSSSVTPLSVKLIYYIKY